MSRRYSISIMEQLCETINNVHAHEGITRQGPRLICAHLVESWCFGLFPRYNALSWTCNIQWLTSWPCPLIVNWLISKRQRYQYSGPFLESVDANELFDTGQSKSHLYKIQNLIPNFCWDTSDMIGLSVLTCEGFTSGSRRFSAIHHVTSPTMNWY